MKRLHTSGRHRPRGLEILHEDRDLFVVNKAPGVLTTGTRRDEAFTAENVLNQYVRKGCARSRKQVYLVHRLDRETSGVLLFAKTEEAQQRLKENWKATEKLYLAIVRGRLPQRQGLFSSYLAENEDLYVHSVDDPAAGKLSQTAYAVIAETPAVSAIKIRLLTGRKNQIRVHFAEAGHAVAGDPKYGAGDPFRERLCLHAKSIAFDHPYSGRRLFFDTPIPEAFARLARGLTEAAWADTVVEVP
ncbi:MAG: RluA family pseudouridine synthase [Kiritimatiellia bacterium]|jgi:tRNA pseudouridine32 synthase/23S rRNA pseudouridine746 synthase/23S rRNA pseudouridine1911/1915/1917 synthase|nr:RluA family pseudouridine synthase [Kiritimatiellia bacterium]MDD4174300.1 RluA family pseudouridine synthase [Kiritimatiellia bacterium]NLC80082.1 RluA family pseudouridine synthase [Lentisphaerota bacterium]